MGNQTEYFTWRTVVKMWAVTALVMTLGAAMTHVVSQAHAGAKFISQHTAK